MATIRVEKLEDFTTLKNDFLDDERLSLKAVGLLSFMLRLPDDWNFTLEWLARKHKDGLASIRSAMTELEEAGYVTRGAPLRSESGTFKSADYIVREVAATACENRTRFKVFCRDNAGFPDSTACENRTRTACDFPTSENPTSENQTQPNTKLPSTKLPNPPYSPPEGTPPKVPKPRKARESKPQPDWLPERFAAFWEAYPRGEAKQAAIRAWDKLCPDESLLVRMAQGLKRQLLSEPWQAGIGIPYASTWLNQRRWEDEVNKAPPPGSRMDTDRESELPRW